MGRLRVTAEITVHDKYVESTKHRITDMLNGLVGQIPGIEIEVTHAKPRLQRRKPRPQGPGEEPAGNGEEGIEGNDEDEASVSGDGGAGEEGAESVGGSPEGEGAPPI